MRYRLKQRAETKYYIWQSIKLTALATQEYAYVFFSWKLAGSLLNKVYPKRYPFILVLVKLSPFILYFQAIPAIIAAIIYGHFNPYMMRLIINGAVAIAALLMLVIYFLMLVAFIKFMHRTRGAESTITETNQKFRTISRYGIISANAGVISLLLLAAYTWTNIDVLLLSAYWFVLGMFGALFYMKTKLFGIIMKVRSIQKGEKIDGCEG
ncbi:hypothetical protein BCR33DRAFT_723466 [Rhizoclosmatium globosum]|uniref:Uncharacterized protein n=1 Tax=Rhizoclosmatium globosum TaxID=329046 RepID=A0A1Y2BCK1_9FUNG|nr:hypothetical protein BCR33DRAFT_723466 [Rhizoclosmatium globosum]|eukprot:ORY32436.1 hypothetical protein BCR33DRAFT_723466 [Rhizoclosmatium globosum]